jgi:hypothetical protein
MPTLKMSVLHAHSAAELAISNVVYIHLYPVQMLNASLADIQDDPPAISSASVHCSAFHHKTFRSIRSLSYPHLLALVPLIIKELLVVLLPTIIVAPLPPISISISISISSNLQIPK